MLFSKSVRCDNAVQFHVFENRTVTHDEVL